MRAAALVARWRIRHRWPGLVALGLLAAVVGGLATGAVAGERRTASAAARLVVATRAPDAFLFAFTDDMAPVAQALAAHPDTVSTWPLSQSIGREVRTKDWYYPLSGEPDRDAELYRPLVDRGRLPADDSTDEVAVTASTARTTGLDVGDTVSVDLYTQAQMLEIAEATEDQPAGSRLELRVVGVIRDATDVAAARSDRFMLASPAFHRARQAPPGTPDAERDNQYRGFAVRARDGAAGMARIAADLTEELGPGAVVVRDQAESLEQIAPANRVLSVGTWVLAAVVLAVGGFVVAQAVRRHLGAHADQELCLRAVGFTRPDGVLTATLPGLVAAATAGLVSVAVAVAVSPLFPLGRSRLLEPSPGLRFDVPVLAAGATATAAATAAAFALVAWFDLRPARRRHRREAPRTLGALATLVRPPVLLGLHLAADPAPGRRGVSARTAVAGAALGVAGLVAATTFSQSLAGIDGSPDRFGVDYDLGLEVPEELMDERLADLGRHPDVEAAAEQRDAAIVVEGREVRGVSHRSTTGSIEPVVVEGRLPSAPDEVLLAPGLLRRLDAEVGDRVRLGRGERARPATVVGAALDPRIVGGDLDDSAYLRPEALAELAEGQPPYPMIVVRYRAGADPAAVTADLDRRWEYAVMDESHPAPPGSVQNLSDVATVPRVLAWFFAGLAVVSLANGVVSVGRRSRSLLGVVRGLGFTGGQVRTTAAAMALSMAAVAVAAGIPLGLVAGSTTWSQVASRVDLVTVVEWPVLVCAALVPVVLAVAAVVSRWPAHRATAEHPADLLRTE